MEDDEDDDEARDLSDFLWGCKGFELLALHMISTFFRCAAGHTEQGR